MKILYDYQIFDSQITGGISKYHADLHTGLQKKGIDTEIGIKHSANIYLKEAGINIEQPFSEDDKFIKGLNFRGKKTLQEFTKKLGFKYSNSHIVNAEYCRNLITNKHIDIFHPTYYNDRYNDIAKLPPVVLTIHDMTYESFPLFFDNLSIIQYKKEWVKRANKIIAISEFTKKEILHHYNFIKEDNIHVVYHGINIHEITKSSISQKKKGKYILYVGERYGYKDFFSVLNALKIVKRKNKDILLYCTGREFSQNEILYINYLNLTDNIKNVGRISENELSDLYREAQLYISASISEGFGLPLLEAMKNSTPMILSDIPVYKEIAKDAAIYFHIKDENELAEAINYVYDNNKVQNELVQIGKQRLSSFSHQQTIENTFKVYNSL